MSFEGDMSIIHDHDHRIVRIFNTNFRDDRVSLTVVYMENNMLTTTIDNPTVYIHVLGVNQNQWMDDNHLCNLRSGVPAEILCTTYLTTIHSNLFCITEIMIQGIIVRETDEHVDLRRLWFDIVPSYWR